MIELTTLHYNPDPRAAVRLHIFQPNSPYYTSYWFAREVTIPDEELPFEFAKEMAIRAIANGQEVRITDSGDYLVLHAKGGRVIYPEGYTAERFWEDACRPKR